MKSNNHSAGSENSQLVAAESRTRAETILGELFVTEEIVTNTLALNEKVLHLLKKNGYTLVKSHQFRFAPFGSTLIYVLKESHVAIHTYPEFLKISVDIHTCKKGDTLDFYNDLVVALNVIDHDYYRFVRWISAPAGALNSLGKPFQFRIAEGVVLGFEPKRTIYDGMTRYQHISIIYNESLGQALFLDGLLQFSDADSNLYGEMLTKQMNQKKCKNVLILGGGEAQVARHLLDYSQAERITIVDLDEEAIEIYKRYLIGVKETLENARVELITDDALHYVAESAKRRKKYDAIVLDLTQWPIGASYDSYYNNFLRDLTQVAPIITFPVPGPRENKLANIAHPLAEGFIRKRFHQLGFHVRFRKVWHPAWGSPQFFGCAEKS